ncbi:MAG: SpoIID/LytB domain-containing protein [Lachnospiraceae bacterium]|nr:SpoIID/LytB domain-containing protein [Lachnospiraceae bacterium]
MGKGNRTIKYICMMMSLVFVLSFTGTVGDMGVDNMDYVHAADKDTSMIRVGLEGIYYNKSSITIRNSAVVFGYSINNSYSKEMSLSGGEFTFKPYKSSISVTGSYKTYDEAKTMADSMGVEAYPILKYHNTWSVATVGSGNVDSYAIMVTSDNGHGFLYTADERGAYPQIMAGSGNSEGVYVVDLGERQYRGRIEIGRYSGSSSLKVVNIVELEEYLYGVVPCEMVYAWHKEALKAQAVCARSYAYTIGFSTATNITRPYSMCDTTSSQVYKGYGAERKSTNEAVDETKGQIIYYNDKPVRAYYSSTSGGSTENVEDVWGTPNGYLRQVSDIYELEPELDPWVITLNTSEIEKLMKEDGIAVGNITDIRPFVMTASGRVYSVEVVGDSSQVITGSRLRKIFSLYSTKYKVIKYGDNPDYVSTLSANGTYAVEISESYIASGNYLVSKASSDIEQFVVMTKDNLINYPAKAPDNPDTYYIAGMGYGHGIGLSQSGAKGMAEAGFTYDEILKHYFTGIEVR